MRTIRITIFSIIAIAILLFIVTQVGEMGAPWFFTLVAIVIVVLILFSLIRAWLR